MSDDFYNAELEALSAWGEAQYLYNQEIYLEEESKYQWEAEYLYRLECYEEHA